MTAVVMARQLVALAAETSAEKKVMLWTAARMAAEKAVPANSVILTRSTGTPRLRAALAEPPTPVIQLPNLVRPRM